MVELGLRAAARERGFGARQGMFSVNLRKFFKALFLAVVRRHMTLLSVHDYSCTQHSTFSAGDTPAQRRCAMLGLQTQMLSLYAGISCVQAVRGT